MKHLVEATLEWAIVGFVILGLCWLPRLFDGVCGNPSPRERAVAALACGDRRAFDVAIRAGSAATACDESGNALLLHAAAQNDLYAVRCLLDRGAGVNAVSKQGNSALIFAAGLNHVEMTRFLLERGADPDYRNVQGQTAMDVAQSNGSAEAAAVLRHWEA